MTGDASQLAQQQEAFTRLSPQIRDLGLYTSDGRELAVEKTVPEAEIGVSRQDGIVSTLDIPSPSAPVLPVEELGMGL
jgi:hypothetical protein